MPIQHLSKILLSLVIVANCLHVGKVIFYVAKGGLCLYLFVENIVDKNAYCRTFTNKLGPSAKKRCKHSMPKISLQSSA